MKSVFTLTLAYLVYVGFELANAAIEIIPHLTTMPQ